VFAEAPRNRRSTYLVMQPAAVEGQTGAQFEIAITFCKRKSGSQKGAGYEPPPVTGRGTSGKQM